MHATNIDLAAQGSGLAAQMATIQPSRRSASLAPPSGQAAPQAMGPASAPPPASLGARAGAAQAAPLATGPVPAAPSSSARRC
eukprot:1227312-Pyramimonas_sp.AAC.1